MASRSPVRTVPPAVLASFPRDVCINTEVALRKEWLDTNGLGGYASSTILNCHTRKYHGLLVAALSRPRGRFVLLSKLEPSVIINEKEFPLSTNKYPGVFHPTGHMYVDSFAQGLYPTIAYQIANYQIRQSIMMVHGKNTVLIRYELLGGSKTVKLLLRPLLAYRRVHEVTRQNMFFRVKTFFEENGFKIDPYEGLPPLYMQTNRRAVFYPGPKWFANFEYLKERSRGYEYQEDLFSPGVFEVKLSRDRPLVIAASTEPLANIEKKRKNEEKRREQELLRCADESEHFQHLKFQAAQHLIRNARGEASVVAGYHWFGEWGRDAIIAAPGLTFYCGRMDQGLDILETFSKRERFGLVPNFLAGEEGGEDSYNSVDASLWLFWALQEYLRRGGRREAVYERFFRALSNIIASHISGSVQYCRLGENGLIYAGTSGSQVTWMDAKAYGRPVTPRNGAPVEVNALWYNALRFWLELARDAGAAADAGMVEAASRLAERVHETFAPSFWSDKEHCLADVLMEHGLDETVRPNQIFAVSLPYSPLDRARQKAVIDKATQHLLTPYGIRSLSPRDRNYHPRYEGDQNARDAAYHQGTVWVWLLGHYGEALLKTADNPAQARAFLLEKLDTVLEKFPVNFGIASIPEILNGDPPHRRKGCISQAWSIAELIRLKTLLKEVSG